MMLNKWIVLFLTTALMLAACNAPVYNQTEANVADIKMKITRNRQKADNQGKRNTTLLVKPGMYVDTTPISLEREPVWLRNNIVIRGDQLPFAYFSRTIAAGTSNNVLVKYQNGLDSGANLSLSYTGNIKGALDALAARSGYVYSIRGNTIYWKAYITRTFDIAFMPGGTDYLMGKKSDSTSQSNTNASGVTGINYTSSSDSEYSNIKGTLSVWRDLEKTIRQLLSPQGKVIVSESTTSVTVRDKAPIVALVGQYIQNMNHNLSKQVLVKIQVLAVNLENSYDYGIDWGLIAKAFHNSPFVFNGNYGTPVSLTALTQQPSINGVQLPVPQIGTQGNGKIPSWTILLNALNQQGKASVVTEPRVVCLNNQVSVIRIVKNEGYVASIQNTALASGSSSVNVGIGTVTSQVTPGNLTTGLTLYILPKIMGESIYLQVNADLSVNDKFTQFGPPNSQIQLPNVTEKSFNQRSKIRSGDTLILAGFRQLNNIVGANQVITSQALGGKASNQTATETIVLITPIILNGSA